MHNAALHVTHQGYTSTHHAKHMGLVHSHRDADLASRLVRAVFMHYDDKGYRTTKPYAALKGLGGYVLIDLCPLLNASPRTDMSG